MVSIADQHLIIQILEPVNQVSLYILISVVRCQLNHLAKPNTWYCLLMIIQAFVYTMKSRSEIIDRMKDVIAEANAAGHKIERVRSDDAKNSSETVSSESFHFS